MKNIRKSLGSVLGLALVPMALGSGVANAAEKIGYSYLEAEYVFGDKMDADVPGAKNLDIDGVRFKGSLALTDYLFAWGSNASLNMDLPGSGNSSLNTQSIGLGGNYTLLHGANQLDAWGGVSYERLDPAGSPAEGYGLSAGLRWNPLEVLELNGFGSYRNYGNFDGFVKAAAAPGTVNVDGWVYGIGAVYKVTPQIGLLANWERWELSAGSNTDPQADIYSVGARWTF